MGRYVPDAGMSDSDIPGRTIRAKDRAPCGAQDLSRCLPRRLEGQGAGDGAGNLGKTGGEWAGSGPRHAIVGLPVNRRGHELRPVP